jgi:hypothetical protein
MTAILRSEQLLAEIRAGIAHLGRTEQLLSEIREGIARQGRTEQLLTEIREGIRNQTDKLSELIKRQGN